MYHGPHVLGTKVAAGTTAAGTLAFTGLNAAHYLVAAATLITLGVILLRLVPRSES